MQRHALFSGPALAFASFGFRLATNTQIPMPFSQYSALPRVQRTFILKNSVSYREGD
jgi:hypothetical protein